MVAINSNNPYVTVYLPKHPRAGSNGHVKEHILIVEGVLGHPLPSGAEVHHVNSNEADNRNKNLVVCENHAYHFLLHKRQRAFDACGHADWLKCKYCKKYAPESELVVKAELRAGAKTPAPYQYHRECEPLYRRQLRARKKQLVRAA